MPRLTARERREAYLREYAYQKKTGKPFFPYVMLHDIDRQPLLRAADRRARDPLVLTRRRRRHQPRRHERRPRPALRGPGRPGGRDLRPASGLVLLLPLPAAADVQEPEPAAARHDHHPDDLDGHPDRHAVHRPHAASAASRAARSRSASPAPWRAAADAHLEGLEGARHRRRVPATGPGVAFAKASLRSLPHAQGAGLGRQRRPEPRQRAPDLRLAVDRLTNGKGGMPVVQGHAHRRRRSSASRRSWRPCSARRATRANATGSPAPRACKGLHRADVRAGRWIGT